MTISNLVIDFSLLWVRQNLICLVPGYYNQTLEKKTLSIKTLLECEKQLTCEISLNLSPALGFLSGWNLSWSDVEVIVDFIELIEAIVFFSVFECVRIS